MNRSLRKERWEILIPDKPSNYSISRINYDESFRSLIIDLDSDKDDRIVRFRFDEIIAYRVSDELNRQLDFYLNVETSPTLALLVKVIDSNYINFLQDITCCQIEAYANDIEHLMFQTESYIIDIVVRKDSPIIYDGKKLIEQED